MALEARGSCVCAFEVDHIFPWARGGLSVVENFMALFWRSNRNVKNDKVSACDDVLPSGLHAGTIQPTTGASEAAHISFCLHAAIKSPR